MFETVPYHLIRSPETIAKQFVLYCTDRFSRDDFEDEVNDFGNVFGHRTTFIAHYCMAMAVYFEVTWVRGERWIFPNIPPEMERMTSRRGATLPASPKESMKHTGVDVSARCLKRWHYFLALMQFWKDETTPFQYSGVVRHDSKVLLYVMFRLKAVLKSVDFQFHHYAVKNTTTWNDYARRHLTSDQVMADRKAHQKTHDELTTLKTWMQHRYEEEADLELEILTRIRGDVDRLTVHRENRRRHLGNEDEYRRLRQKLAEEQNQGRGAQGAFNQERETRDQRRESESLERQQYAREREEQIKFQQSEPYPSSEPDSPTQPEPSSRGGAKPKTKLSLEDYRSRQLQKEAAKEKEERESIEDKKVKQARLHEIKIWQAEVAQIKQEQEQLCLEQERVQKEQEANAALLASQAWQVPVALGSHTPCYDEHGQELDYHDDVPVATDSQECKSWSDYFRQRGDEYGVQLADSIDTEHRAPARAHNDIDCQRGGRVVGGGDAYHGHEAVFSGTGNPHAHDVERSLYMHQTPVPAGDTSGVPCFDAKEIASSAPARPTRHTDCSQPHGAGFVESDEQPWNVTSLPVYAYTPSRCGRD